MSAQTRFKTEAEILEAIEANQKELSAWQCARPSDSFADRQYLNDQIARVKAHLAELKNALSAFRTQQFPFAADDPSVVV